MTGGAGSIGLATARLFLREGAKVMLIDLDEAGLEAAVRLLDDGNVATVAADAGDASATRDYIERTVQKFGAIDVLFSNAGNQGPVVPVTEYPEDAFDNQISVHVRGAFLARKYGLPSMRDGGSLIITSSVVGEELHRFVPQLSSHKIGDEGLERGIAAAVVAGADGNGT